MTDGEHTELEKSNKSLVEAFFRAMNAGSVDEVAALFSADSTYWIGKMDLRDEFPGRDFARRLGKFCQRSATGTIDVAPVAFTIDGDRVAVEAESRALLRDGRVYENVYHFVFVCRGGKIVALREYADTHVLVELYARPRPGAEVVADGRRG